MYPTKISISKTSCDKKFAFREQMQRSRKTY